MSTKTKTIKHHARGRGKSGFIGLWIDEDVLGQLKDRAEREGRPLSNLVRFYLMHCLKNPPSTR